MPGRTIAVGDIHGCIAALDALIAAIRPRPEDLIVTLGDSPVVGHLQVAQPLLHLDLA